MIVALVATGMRLISPHDAVLPVRAAAGGHRAVPRIGQQDAHRGGRRRTRRLPALPVGGPRQRARTRRRTACRAGMVASRAGGAGEPSPAPAGSGNAIRTTPTSSCCAPGLHDAAARRHAAGQGHRRRDRPGAGVAHHPSRPARHPAHGPRRARPASTSPSCRGSRWSATTTRSRGALRAWIAQAVTWHDPTVLGIALAGPDLEDDDWSWLKWLPHVDVPGADRRCRPGALPHHRRQPNCAGCSCPRWPIANRSPATSAGASSICYRARRPRRRPQRLHRARGLAGVTVIHRSTKEPHREQYSDPERPILRIADGRIERWQNGGWQPYVDTADRLGAADARHIARRLSRWDSNPEPGRSTTTGGAAFTTLLGIPDASALDVAACGRRATATTNCGCRSASPPPANRCTSTSRTRPRAAWARTA